MTDEATVPVVPPSTDVGGEEAPAAPATAAPEPPPQEPPKAAQAETPTWQQTLDTIDVKELRKHPRVAGVLGSAIQTAIQAERERVKAEEGGKAAREAEANLRQLAGEDPVAFAEKWLSETQKQDILRQLDGLHGKARHELATNIGRAYNDVPEWAELSEADHETLAKAVLGQPDDEVIPIFNRVAFDLVANKRTDKKFAERWAKEEAKLREAIRQEEAAKLMAKTAGPDIAKPKGLPARINIASMSDAEFEKYWADKHK